MWPRLATERCSRSKIPSLQNKGTGRCLLLGNTCLQSILCTHHSLN